MQLQENISLQPYNTFGLEAKARFFTAFDSVKLLKESLLMIRDNQLKYMILGGGSNILLTQPYEGIVLLNKLKGITVVDETSEHIFVKSEAGESWHDLVLYCIENNYAGIENMSLIPGSVGAAPMQNIGAYGVEVKDVFHSLEAIHVETGEIKTFHAEECEFGYRESVFKRSLKGQYIIISVTLRLNKTPEFKTSYGAISAELESMGIKNLSIKAISDAVIAIRKSKLPDPAEIGNSGSFFKNPVLASEVVEKIKVAYPNIASYPAGEGLTKVAAGWLIEQAGWKGKTFGNYGVHKNQALVLVNYGGATGKEIYDLSVTVIKSVKEKFGIELEREVNVV